MRELKFRAWDKFHEKYICTGFHVIGEVTVFGMIDMEIKETYQDRKDKFGHEDSFSMFDDFIIEQYTGLKDKNGVEIFEGDILNSKSSVLFVIAWSDHCGRVMAKQISGSTYGRTSLETSSMQKLEVIGNVHESPELLEPK